MDMDMAFLEPWRRTRTKGPRGSALASAEPGRPKQSSLSPPQVHTKTKTSLAPLDTDLHHCTIAPPSRAPSMEPVRTRLTCRAHHCWSPSCALWQYRAARGRPMRSQQRLSSTHGPTKDACDVAAQPVQKTPATETRVPIRKLRVDKGEWHASKVDASVAKNLRIREAKRQADQQAVKQHLRDALNAFQRARDYTGQVVAPMTHQDPGREQHLPWAFSSQERAEGRVTGADRQVDAGKPLAVEIERFSQYIQPTHYESVARKHLIEQTRNQVRAVLPDYVLEVFGSERTGLAHATSDIDFRLVKKAHLADLEQDSLPPTGVERRRVRRALMRLFKRIAPNRELYLFPRFRHARYPLVSLQHRESGLELQIVLANDTSLARDMIKEYMNEWPYLRDLFFVVTTMFKIRGLTDVYRGGFGSYTLFMMLVASLRHDPNPRNDAAGGLLNFMRFYSTFDTTTKGLSIEPTWMFDKGNPTVLTATTQAKLEKGKVQSLPAYMLCLRDPADATNDLGRRAVAIKHAQVTLAALLQKLRRDLKLHTRASILSSVVGPSYMLEKEHRSKLAEYGKRLSDQKKKEELARTAERIREGESAASTSPSNQEDEELEELQQKRMPLVMEKRNREWQRLLAERDYYLARKPSGANNTQSSSHDHEVDTC
ncbi:hypothetical protein ACEQ8H_001129 [Pleosporales sp. CAS-2024a]